jgi:pimeloyl-ACP methyl ester carboxylesterase
MDHARHQPRLVLFAGLAADPRLYDVQRRAFPSVKLPAWPPHLRGETIQGYSRRLAATIPASPGPLFLGGLSFGAVVALEAARHLPAAGVFAISGADSYRDIALPFRLLCHAARVAPAWVVTAGKPIFPLALRVIERLTDEQARLYAMMANEMDSELIRWCAASLIGWEYTGWLDGRCPVHVIHGDRDEIIPIRRVRPTCVIRGGHHLVTLTHPEELNDCITRILSAGAGGPIEWARAVAAR